MLLSESLVWALEEYEISGVKIICSEAVADRLADNMVEIFAGQWAKIVEIAEEEYGDCEVSEMPISVCKKDYGIFVTVGSLDIRYNGDYFDMDTGPEVLKRFLGALKKGVPEIEYEGYVGYPVSDGFYGEAYQFELCSGEPVKLYDFVGETLGKVLSEEPEQFCEKLLEQLESYEDFEATIEKLQAYSKWIDAENLKNLITEIIDLAAEMDDDLAEVLAGKYEDCNEDDSDENDSDEDNGNLPDGYMEALAMFMKAEEISGVTAKPGQVISSDDTFGVVIAQAEAGDAEAKFTAGQYFIADNIEEEKDRAIKWIREAADAGVDEAVKYMQDNEELF